jgi:hypothetical protein
VSWTPIEDASDAFERPAWAIEKMVQKGELERRIDKDGRVFVRRPRTLAELADELVPFLPEEVVPVVVEIEEEPEPRETALAEPSREEMLLRAVFKLLERQQRAIEELQRAPRALPAPPPPPPPPPAPPPPPPAPPRRHFTPLVASVLVLAIGAGLAFAAESYVTTASERTERALDHAEWLARELVSRSVAAPQSSTTTLPASFRR